MAGNLANMKLVIEGNNASIQVGPVIIRGSEGVNLVSDCRTYEDIQEAVNVLTARLDEISAEALRRLG